jgi:hypothetical protein
MATFVSTIRRSTSLVKPGDVITLAPDDRSARGVVDEPESHALVVGEE